MVTVRAIAVLCNKRIALAVLGRIHARTRSACRHGLVGVLAHVELLQVLVVMHALHDLGPHERRLGHDALQRHHVVQLVRAEGARIHRKFSKAANVGAVVFHFVGCLGFGPVCECFDDIFEARVEGLDEGERLVE